MSRSPREPQSKLRPPEGASSAIPPRVEPVVDAPVADAPVVAESAAELPALAEPVAGSTKPDETKAIAVPAPAPVAPVAPALPPSTAATPPVEPAPPAVAPAVARYVTPVAPAPGEAVSLAGDAALDDEPAPPLTLRDRLRRLSPVFVTMIVGSIGSTVFLALALTSHTTPVAVLVGAAVVTTLVYALDAVMCTAVTYRAGQDGEAGRALLFAVVGGISAVICALAMAGTLILVLVLNS